MNHQETEPSYLTPCMLSMIGLYVGFALVVYVDEQVIGGKFIYNPSPQWLIDALRVAYWPVLKLAGIIP